LVRLASTLLLNSSRSGSSRSASSRMQLSHMTLIQKLHTCRRGWIEG
jgi:hypothetical protein